MPIKNLLSTAIVIVIIVVVIIIAVFVYIGRRTQLAKLTAEAPAEVVSVSVDTDRTRNNNRSRTRHTTKISYRYTVGGKVYNANTNKSGDVKSTYERGQPVKTCYEPAHPENSEIFTHDYNCGR